MANLIEGPANVDTVSEIGGCRRGDGVGEPLRASRGEGDGLGYSLPSGIDPDSIATTWWSLYGGA